MNKSLKSVAGAIAAGLALVLSLGACSAGADDLAPSNQKITQVIDVRTAEEYALSHIDGAINIDVESGDFAAGIAQLDKSGVYLVYCHSGRRSAIAAGEMESAGLTVLDGGAFQSMLDRGWQLAS